MYATLHIAIIIYIYIYSSYFIYSNCFIYLLIPITYLFYLFQLFHNYLFIALVPDPIKRIVHGLQKHPWVYFACFQQQQQKIPDNVRTERAIGTDHTCINIKCKSSVFKNIYLTTLVVHFCTWNAKLRFSVGQERCFTLQESSGSNNGIK